MVDAIVNVRGQTGFVGRLIQVCDALGADPGGPCRSRGSVLVLFQAFGKGDAFLLAQHNFFARWFETIRILPADSLPGCWCRSCLDCGI